MENVKDERKINFFMVNNEAIKLIQDVYAFKVYCCLIKYSFGKGKCFPSLNTISFIANISLPKVMKSIKYLEVRKIIKIERKGRKHGNVYFMKDIKDWSTAQKITEKVEVKK